MEEYVIDNNSIINDMFKMSPGMTNIIGISAYLGLLLFLCICVCSSVWLLKMKREDLDRQNVQSRDKLETPIPEEFSFEERWQQQRCYNDDSIINDGNIDETDDIGTLPDSEEEISQRNVTVHCSIHATNENDAENSSPGDNTTVVYVHYDEKVKATCIIQPDRGQATGKSDTGAIVSCNINAVNNNDDENSGARDSGDEICIRSNVEGGSNLNSDKSEGNTSTVNVIVVKPSINEDAIEQLDDDDSISNYFTAL